MNWDMVMDDDMKEQMWQVAGVTGHAAGKEVPRPFTNCETQDTCSWHKFCVASKVAYAAVVVLRFVNGQEITAQPVHAKPQAAPLKNIIPVLGLLIYCIGDHLTASVREPEFI